MRRSFTVAVAAATVATSPAMLGPWASGAELGRAQPPGGDISGGGVHLTASVDSVGANPPGDRTPNFLMTFSHAVQMSGDYSVTVDGGQITSGQAVAGFILGCGISVDGGVTVGIDPHQGLVGSISPSISSPSASVSPPSVTAVPTSTSPPSVPAGPPSVSLDLDPTIGGILGLSEVLAADLGPGQITKATTATARLDTHTTFPYRIRFSDTSLTVAQCASPVSAVPFVTVTVTTARGMAQTTAYGDQFTF
ncbi:MspA family porin [Nocardia tengchongensis]|uniref:MspA family porin n=1 Tax=Nocardia tengchongensis TaxID=2055889 RepID=UPI00361EC750